MKKHAMQLTATRKRIKLGGIEVVHGEIVEDEEPRHDMAHYLNNPLALLIAYSIPGAQGRAKRRLLPKIEAATPANSSPAPSTCQ